jgi:ribonuclease Y
LALATVAEIASILPQGGFFDSAISVSLFVGVLVGFIVVWVVTRYTRRGAHEQAAELVEVGKREAAVGAEELKQKAEAEIQEKRAELNREFDRREIESDIRLREIKAHEESLGLLDF